VLGLACHRSLTEGPGPVDLAVLAVPNAALEGQLAAAAAAGVPAAVIFASCQDPEPAMTQLPPLAERLRRIAGDAGMAVCGGNGMGFFNLEHSLRVCGYPEPAELPCGPVAVVTHSGSVFSALLHNDRGLRFNLVVSAGMELVTTAAAYLDHALELPSTRVVALFLETVREPVAFRAALAKAAARGIPVVALKVGRGPAARELVAAHSGAMAGEDGAYQALFDAYGWRGCAAWTSWPTPASCWPPGAGHSRAGWPPSTTRAASAPTWWTWPRSWGCRWRASPRRPGRGWRPCWSRAARHQPAGRLGHRQRRRRDLCRLHPRAARGPRHRGAGGRPGPDQAGAASPRL
jgi:hypothetical protein